MRSYVARCRTGLVPVLGAHTVAFGVLIGAAERRMSSAFWVCPDSGLPRRTGGAPAQAEWARAVLSAEKRPDGNRGAAPGGEFFGAVLGCEGASYRAPQPMCARVFGACVVYCNCMLCNAAFGSGVRGRIAQGLGDHNLRRTARDRTCGAGCGVRGG
jgi:hypothetical protein